jgi:hypothetical protein
VYSLGMARSCVPRIGEVGTRRGVSRELLRAREQRDITALARKDGTVGEVTA